MNKYNFNKRVNILNNQIKGEKVIIKELIPNVYKLSFRINFKWLYGL